MPGDLFSYETFIKPVSLIPSALELTCNVTVFDWLPGELGTLPDALGGDPTQWTGLQ